jgi:hypothetical protein
MAERPLPPASDRPDPDVGLHRPATDRRSAGAAGCRVRPPHHGHASHPAVGRAGAAGPYVLLRLAEQVLDEVDRALPVQMSTPGTVEHRAQQIARADLAVRRSTVAQYLDDFEGATAASRQAADHYSAATAPAHAATEIIHTANRLSAVGQHTAAAELLDEVPDDLAPPVRRLLLVVRAATAQRAAGALPPAACSPPRERSPKAASSRSAGLSCWNGSNIRPRPPRPDLPLPDQLPRAGQPGELQEVRHRHGQGRSRATGQPTRKLATADADAQGDPGHKPIGRPLRRSR